MRSLKRTIVIAFFVTSVTVAYVLGGKHSARENSSTHQPSHRILYYVDPMHPSYRSDKPGIAPDCGMQLEPVYEDSATSSLPAGVLSIPAAELQLIGVRTVVVHAGGGTRTVHTSGRVVADENHLYKLYAGFDGWVESIHDTPAGMPVKRDQLLATLFSPEVRNAQINYLGFLAGIERLKGNSTGNESQLIRDTATVNAEQLRLLGMDPEQIKHLGESRRPSSNLDLVSPIDGIVLARNITPQAHFDRGSELYRIADLSHIWIIANLRSEEGLPRPGTQVQIFSSDLKHPFFATVSAAQPLVDEATRTLKLRLEADNPGQLLRPDMYVDIEYHAQSPNGISIPADAILESGAGHTVFVETAVGVYERRNVSIGGALGENLLITSGIKDGEKIVVEGNFLLDSESRLHASAPPIATPAANQSTMTGAQTDPVCGMQFSSSKFDATFKGLTYHFCSDGCRKKFQADPSKYTSGNASSVMSRSM
jgi:RND family efflux transporter MFP subunit